MKKGFTLIELLVVIAIIAILAAILFPVFAQAREKARAASCLSNTKQFGTALQLYMDDYDETYPPKTSLDSATQPADTNYPSRKFAGKWVDFWFGGPQYSNWMDCIYPYVKNINMYVCPSGIKNIPGYGYSSCMMGLYNNNGDVTTWTPPTAVMIPSTSETVCFADCAQYNGNTGIINIEPKQFWTAAELTAIGAENFFQTVSGWKSPCRHNSGANFTMADGHAKFYKNGQGPLEFHDDQFGLNSRWWNFTKQN